MSDPAIEPVVDHKERCVAAAEEWRASRARYESARQALYVAIRDAERPVLQGGGGIGQSVIGSWIGWDRRNVWMYVHKWRGKPPEPEEE